MQDFQNELQQDEADSLDILYNKHMMNLKQLDYMRKEKRAEYNIKQRDNYIEQLKQQLLIRDQLIKEKLGSSVSNFLKQDAAGASSIFTLKDMEQLNEEMMFPALKMTKSNNFLRHRDPDADP